MPVEGRSGTEWEKKKDQRSFPRRKTSKAPGARALGRGQKPVEKEVVQRLSLPKPAVSADSRGLP